MVGFLNLPPEIRLMVYKNLPNPMEAGSIDPFSSEKRQSLNVSLLYSNKTVYNEYRGIFYSGIEFDFTEHTYERFAKFLDQIGPHNAKHIRHMYIGFPLCEGDPADLAVDDDIGRTIGRIKRDCPRLEMLIFDLSRNDNYMLKELQSTALNEPDHLRQSLSALDKRLSDIPSLQEVYVEVLPDELENWDEIFTQLLTHGFDVWVKDDDLSNGVPEDWEESFDYSEYFDPMDGVVTPPDTPSSPHTLDDDPLRYPWWEGP